YRGDLKIDTAFRTRAHRLCLAHRRTVRRLVRGVAGRPDAPSRGLCARLGLARRTRGPGFDGTAGAASGHRETPLPVERRSAASFVQTLYRRPVRIRSTRRAEKHD